MTEQVSDKVATLVVGDSATILATAKKMLDSEFVVFTAKDGEEAWQIICDNEQIKIVFSDMQMPVLNGMQLLLRIRESDDLRISKLPVIMITGQSDSPAGKRAVFDIGATDFIGKPFDAMDLLSRARTNTLPQRRESDRKDVDAMLTPSAFQSIGNQSLVKALNINEEFTVVNVEFCNIDELKQLLDSKSVRQVILSIIKRLTGALREDDIATRIGENKFSILLNSNQFNAESAVERISAYMSKLVFELKGSTLKTILAYGYSTLNCDDKDIKFIDLCAQADEALKIAKTIKLGHRVSGYSAAGGGELNRIQGNSVDLTSAMKHVFNGDYYRIDKSEAAELKVHMEKFLDYLSN